MSTDAPLSANARKLQEDEIERLVKCRLRSEIEARKAVESTMKRAVQEARELKKELVLLRQEKEELRRELQARKHAVSAPGDSKRGDDPPSAAVAAAVKAAEKKFAQQLQGLAAENAELREQHAQLESDSAALVHEKSAQLAQCELELQTRVKVIAALEDDAKKLRAVCDETKRKYQRMVKEKREDLAKSQQENEHLARCKETLERQLELLPQLKKQLQLAKDKSSGVAEDWQRKLELRDEAFLRQEAENAARVAELQREIAQLTSDREQLGAQLDELTSRVYENEQAHDAAQRKQATKCEQLAATTRGLQDKLLRATDELQDAQRAREIAEETLAQEAKLRQMADDAADAVEARALKCAAQLEQATQQLAQLERALETRGITFDFLLKAPAAGSSSNKELATEKRRERPETPVAPTTKHDARAGRSSNSGGSISAATTGLRRTASSAKPSREPAAPTKPAVKAVPATLLKSKLAQSQMAPPGTTAAKPRAAAVGTKRVPLSHRTSTSSRSNNNDDAERDGTPERTRRG